VIAELVVPTLWSGAGWMVTTRSDAAVRALRDRHYSTKYPGGRTVGPPGRVVVLRTEDGLAGWVTHYPAPELALDGLDVFRCSLFRNEGPTLSSTLVLEAMAISEELLEVRPTDGWATYIEPAKLASRNPGYCFLRAGWSRDREWRHPRLLRLRAPLR
jgi:hypothetical protein